jgi:hypothetical protein
MTYEARITVHQRGLLKPNYSDIHQRMARAGYGRVLTIGGYNLNELHGMYRKTLISSTNIDTERTTIQNALRANGFAFSIELFEVGATRAFNLEPAQVGSLVGSLYR